MKLLKLLFLPVLVALLHGCAVLQPPIITQYDSVDNYRYAVIPATNTLTSGTGGIYGGQYGLYGATTSKAVNPGSVIEGILLKRGIVGVDEVRPDATNQTMIVRYGESGKRVVAGGIGGYTLEVTIVFLDASTQDPIYTCTAEGQGSTEADDIRKAITRCLSGL